MSRKIKTINPKMDSFFSKRKEMLTFDDVLLKTGYADVLPKYISVETIFSKNIPLKIPIVSAAMDTVTEYKMAIELAKLGGLGVIHKNLTPEEQFKQVKKVKFELNAIVEKPITVNANFTVEQLLNMKQEKNYKFSTFPIINNSGNIVGMISSKELKYNSQKKHKLIKDIMKKDLITIPKKISLKKAYNIMEENEIGVLPIVEGGKLKSMYTFQDVERIRANLSPMNNVDSKGQLIVAASIGVGKDALQRVELLYKYVDVVVLGTAHADSRTVHETLRIIRKEYSGLEIVVGNVSEPDAIRRLAKIGVDGILVGQGPGSICSTRIVSGIGAPQISAVYNCAKEAAKYGIPVCADGGITESGQISKAIAAGATSVMLGSMLAGTEESPGEEVTRDNRKWKTYRGMGSLAAMKANKGSRERYSQDDTGKSDLIPEGVESLVPYKGLVKELIIQYVGGLKSGMGYTGSSNIDELRKKTTFHQITNAGLKESHPHDVLIINEPLNYNVKK